MPLGMEVGLGPGDFVFDEHPAPPGKRIHPPDLICGACLLWPNGLMDEDATWYGSRPRPSPHCIRWGPSCPRKGHSSPLFFGPFLLWPRSPISTTAELSSRWRPLTSRINFRFHFGCARVLRMLGSLSVPNFVKIPQSTAEL